MKSRIGFVFTLAFALASLSAAQSRIERDGARYPSALIIAHRGGAKESTENTIAAFQRAVRLGAGGIETDVRLSRDGVAVIYHDERFGRVEGLAPPQRTRLISDMTYKELSAQTLLPVGEDTGGRRVPTLAALLTDVKSGLLNIEIKRGAHFDYLVDQIIEQLRHFSELDRVVLEAPDLKTAEKLRNALPQIKLHINPAYDGTVPFNESLERVLRFHPHSISVNYKKVSLEMVELAHRSGVEVWAWTVDEPEIAQALALMGVDAIKTDRPKVLLDVLRSLRAR